MSNFPSLPYSMISSNTVHENNALIYKTKPVTDKIAKKRNRLAPLLHPSSSMRDFSQKSGSIHDIEKIYEEMIVINREIKQKTRIYDRIKKEHDKVEEENAVLINILDNLIAECKEIEEPLEKRSKDINKEENKTQTLISKMKNKYELFKKELFKKEEILRKLKENERTIRLFELDEKMKEAKINLAQVRKEQPN